MQFKIYIAFNNVSLIAYNYPVTPFMELLVGDQDI